MDATPANSWLEGNPGVDHAQRTGRPGVTLWIVLRWQKVDVLLGRQGRHLEGRNETEAAAPSERSERQKGQALGQHRVGTRGSWGPAVTWGWSEGSPLPAAPRGWLWVFWSLPAGPQGQPRFLTNPGTGVESDPTTRNPREAIWKKTEMRRDRRARDDLLVPSGLLATDHFTPLLTCN